MNTNFDKFWEYHLGTFGEWFDPDQHDWERGSYHLAESYSRCFNKWFDPDKFNWERSSSAIAKHCDEYFDEWFDPDKFNWEQGERFLLKYCCRYINKWYSHYPNRDRLEFTPVQIAQFRTNNIIRITKNHIDKLREKGLL